MQNQGFDSRLLLTIGLTFLVFFGYQAYLQKKYPDHGKQKSAVTPTAPAAPEGASNEKAAPAATLNTNTQEQVLKYEDNNWEMEISSVGMSVRRLVLKNYSDRESKPIEFLPAKGTDNLSTYFIGRNTPIRFSIKKTSENQFVGSAVDGKSKITKTLSINSEKGVFDVVTRVENPEDHFIGLATKLSADIIEQDSSTSFLPLPSFEHQEIYFSNSDDSYRHILTKSEAMSEVFKQADTAGVVSQYFTLAVKNKSDVIPEADWNYSTADGKNGSVIALLNHKILNRTADFNVSMRVYAGPKAYDSLKSAEASFSGIVNFGFFNTLAVWIYRLLQYIFSMVNNWGTAIIVLTIIVRLLVMPFNIMSYKSMRVMSKLQPQVKAIQAKYKDDRVKANEEVMKLMRENKANPLGGCLPMFLQIPIFFALYQVLGQSIELYKAPFILWINDLSIHDPYYVVPVLMTVTMYLQQKFTPSTMEPAQQKIMMFMLLGFSVFFITLPAGLTLYMFVSTLFGVLQQVYFLKEKKAAT